MYESPITIVYGDIQTEFKKETESLIVRCVQNVGVDVNKDELIEALSYDRYQYDKGYADAKAEIVHCKDCKHFNRDIPCVGGHYNGCDAWTDNGNEIVVAEDGFCSYAERRTE